MIPPLPSSDKWGQTTLVFPLMGEECPLLLAHHCWSVAVITGLLFWTLQKWAAMKSVLLSLIKQKDWLKFTIHQNKDFPTYRIICHWLTCSSLHCLNLLKANGKVLLSDLQQNTIFENYAFVCITCAWFFLCAWFFILLSLAGLWCCNNE